LQKLNKLELVKYLKSNEALKTKFVPRTKHRLLFTLSNEILRLCEEEILLVFNQYLESNLFHDSDAQQFFKVHDFFGEKNSKHLLLK
jgi:hypothetical protein